MTQSYDAKDITVLGGLSAVRKRPGMYIGSTSSRGLHHLVYEVVDNSIDEAMAGHAKNIKVVVHKTGKVSVADDGRGIPIGMHPKYKKPTMEIIMTKLHSGGKFDKNSYKVSGGLHGVGLAVVNALSEELDIFVKREGKVHTQKYKKGKPVTQMKLIGKDEGTGTMVTFKPDPEIFTVLEYQFDILVARLRELAFLNKGIKIQILDERTNEQKLFHYDGGIISFVEYLNQNKNPVHNPIYFEKTKNDVIVEVAMQYNSGFKENIFSFVNNINTIEGGTHLSGFKTALTRTINKYINNNNKDVKLSSDDVREGVAAVISVKVPEPQFEGQTKTKLGNSEVKGIVDSTVSEALTTFLEENPKIASLILDKAVNAAKAREAARKAKDLVRRKGLLEGSTLPGKLADCSEKDPSKCEVYIVEGDSAGGCFSDDTKVALVDGRNLSFKELIKEDKKGKKNYCYTIKEDGSVGISLIKHPRKTKSNVEVIKLILDNNEEIICTPDHRFMTRNNEYVNAIKLTNTQSLMPLKRKLSKIEKRITIAGYEMVLCPKTHKWIFTHLLADRYNLEKDKYSIGLGSDKHHIDFNKLNNSPDNILQMKKDEHMAYHAMLVEKILHREDIKQKATKTRRTPEFRKRMSKIMSSPEMKKMLSERAKKQWENEDYKEFMIRKYLEFYESNEEYRKENLKILNREQKKYWAKKENREQRAEQVKKYFEEHPEAREELSLIAKKQWENTKLKEWRSEKTKEQWTPEFREKRKEAYDKTYFKQTISFMKNVLDKEGSLENYDQERTKKRNTNLLKKETFVKRFFNDNESAMIEAVAGYNHKIKEIVRLPQKMDVYDLEVEGTHNFALASGVFVHNSAKQARNRETQAVLPLRGKVLNVEKARLAKILKNNEIVAIITALGVGIEEEFDISKLRYGRTIIMCDSDVDGAHISILLLTFFFRYMKPLIENGNIYLALPPLYKVKKGKSERYALNDKERDAIINEFGKQGVSIQRYKGLGEMNPKQLWETTMDPEKRYLKQVTIEDGVEADRQFSNLMGEDVEPRRNFIQENAMNVVNLDV